MSGSSPRGRGTPVRGWLAVRSPRFIPARAGNTRQCQETLVRQTVHPRAGGEHNPGHDGAIHDAGSSPRGRGTRKPQSEEETRSRFIPARAGNTPRSPTCTITSTVHPRAGGEHVLGISRAHGHAGSSPRGRGTHVAAHAVRVVGRFIPARAGNTRIKPRIPLYPSVHPRAGGEHPWWNRNMLLAGGSSPRGRGTLSLIHDGDSSNRFIPARAGNTCSKGRLRPRVTVHPRAGGEHSVRRE